VTGHTGFKGAWLSLMLMERGDEVCGIALDPKQGSLFETAGVAELLKLDVRGDIREPDAVQGAVQESQPDVVVHMAAQPLVRESYARPRWTMETNVMGTFNVLEAVSAVGSVRAQVMVTTDKVYLNVGQDAGYLESDSLGAGDPYSTSKAMADLLVQSWKSSFDGPPTAVARAGNVLGGGDISTDRLMPDLLTAFASGQPAELRYPDAVRPWQHVLDCLNGYLHLVDALLAGSGEGEWNFGPGPDGFRTVRELAAVAAEDWGDGASWREATGEHVHEAQLLALDAAKAERELGWRNQWDFAATVAATVAWQKWVDGDLSPREATVRQIRRFYESSSD
jgi:CDP-glucose 4,6-dehydratase